VIDQLIRSRRRTLGLQITPDARVIVRAPRWATSVDIHNLVNDKLEWIRKIQTKLRLENAARVEPRFESGESFSYLGEKRVLALLLGSSRRLTFDGAAFSLGEFSRPRARRHFETWSRRQAREVLTARVDVMAARAGLSYAALRITGAKTRWGSCSSKGTLNFTWRLVMAPLDIIDYVVAHEVTHLVHHNHSKRFWTKVAALYPDYRRARAWLREHQRELSL
jgi:predicted metal-dependent hydrolase